jgi:hypothetical protein
MRRRRRRGGGGKGRELQRFTHHVAVPGTVRIHGGASHRVHAKRPRRAGAISGLLCRGKYPRRVHRLVQEANLARGVVQQRERIARDAGFVRLRDVAACADGAHPTAIAAMCTSSALDGAGYGTE